LYLKFFLHKTVELTQNKAMIYIYNDVTLIKFKASQLWNQLPNELKENQHSFSFKQQLKSICLVN